MTARPTFTISELAQEFAVTTRTIRFYEEKGLLSPRRKGQHRIYRAADRTRLRLILRGKRLGLSLQESRDIIDLYGTVAGGEKQRQALIQKIRERKAVLEAQLQDVQAVLGDLAEVERRCLAAMQTPAKTNQAGRRQD